MSAPTPPEIDQVLVARALTLAGLRERLVRIVPELSDDEFTELLSSMFRARSAGRRSPPNQADNA